MNLYNRYILCEEEEEEDKEPRITFFYEYHKYKTLKYIINNKIQLTPVQRQIIIIGIAYGLYYLSQKKVVHGCLNPTSIWLDENFYPKIYMANSILNKDYNDIKYQSPELFQKNSVATEQSDVFSFGRLLYYLITGSDPFRLKNDKLRGYNSFKLMCKIIDGANPLFPEDVPDSYRELLEKCWSISQYERPSAEKIFYEIITNDKLRIKGIDEDIQKVDDYINELTKFQDNLPKSILSIEYNYEATVDEYDLLDSLDELIHSKSMFCDEKDILKIFIKAAECEYFQKDEKLLQEVIHDINKLSSKGNEDAKEFLKIVFGDPITNILEISLKNNIALNIGDTNVSIPKGLFCNYNNLIRVNIPNSVKKIECEAFCECSNLTFVNIPESIKDESIGEWAFKNCAKFNALKCLTN